MTNTNNNIHLQVKENTQNLDIVTIFCFFDDLCKSLGLMEIKNPKGGRPSCLNLSECLTIILMQKEYCIENKKALYKYDLNHYKSFFPKIGTYKFLFNTK